MNYYQYCRCYLHATCEHFKWWAMRVSVIVYILLIVIAQLKAENTLAQNLTIHAKNQSLETVLRQIKKQSGYDLLYSPGELEKQAEPVSVNVTKAPLQTVLNEIFRQQKKLEYVIDQRAIIVRQKQKSDTPITAVQETIRGRVTDSIGNPLPNVTVSVVGSSIKGMTDANGYYELTGASTGSTLLFTSVGYQPYRTNIDRPEINIRMYSYATAVEAVDIINTGFQSLPRERATGSFVVLDSALINRRVSTNILDRLDGVTGGLIFNKTNNADEMITIRGRTTINASAEPLIVLDNFPYSGNLANINPNDVASITVLKDAAAASIWGARSGNGVIVITTKKGKQNEKMHVSFNGNITIGEKPDLYYTRNYLDAAGYIEAEQILFDRGFYNAFINNTTNRPALTPAVELMVLRRNATNSADSAALLAQINDLKNYDVRRDFDQYVNRKSVNQQYSLAFRGGGSNYTYAVSGGYDKNLDNRIRSENDRKSFNALNTFKPTDKLEFTTGVNYVQTQNADNSSFANTATSYYSNRRLYPYARLADDNGNPLTTPKDYRVQYVAGTTDLGYLDWTYRLLDEINLTDNVLKVDNFFFRSGAKYAFTEHLNTELQYQYERQGTNRRNHRSQDTYYVRNLINRYSQRDATTGAFTYPIPVGGMLTMNDRRLFAHNVRAQANYSRSINGLHDITAILGGEVREVSSEQYERLSYGYNDELGTATNNLNYTNIYRLTPSGTGSIPAPDGTVGGTLNRFISYYTNIGYTYDNRYTITLSGRKDGTNLFGVKTNQKITPLWSAGLGWTISGEDFYHFDYLPYLNLRTTYGFNGNVFNQSAYLIAQYSVLSQMTGLPSASVMSPPNPELRWERVRNTNIGLDFKSINNILSGSVEVYYKDGLDLVQDEYLAPSTGFQTFKGNSARVSTKGVDITLTTRNISGRINWTTDFLFSSVNDKVKHYDLEYNTAILVEGLNPQGSGSMIPVVGNSLYGLYTYRWAGLDPATGDPLGYVDGAESKDYIALVGAGIDDLSYHGSTRPTRFGAVRNTFSWNNLSLSFNIMYKFGYVFRRGAVNLNYAEVATTTLHADYHLRWQNPGDELHTDVPSLVYPNNVNRSDFYRFNEVLVERGDHIRLQDINLSYNLTRQTLPWLPSRNVQLYLYADNLGIIWRKNRHGIDPDFNDSFLNPVNYPTPRSFAFGINANF